MGIRGAWSLLSNDPRRFGRPWVLSSADEQHNQQIVFIDGPSLLYHVAENGIYDDSPPLAKQRDAFQQINIDAIYRRVRNFALSILEITQLSEVHVVMDGLAHPAKLASQISRLSDVSKQCEYLANTTQPSTRHNILPFLAESAMTEAVEDQISLTDRLHLHRPSHGEAETYIHQWLEQHPVLPSTRISILSNDTDFVIYAACPGFIPLSTLSFHAVGGKLGLSGFEYLRSKVVAAFVSHILQDESTINYVLTSTAALVGCDYHFSIPALQSLVDEARHNIAKSDLGGLRQRERNNPSAASMLTATLRFIAYFIRQSKSTNAMDWKEAMVAGIFTESPKQTRLRQALEEIHEIYFPDYSIVESTNMNSSDTYRLLECGILFCRPVVETWRQNKSGGMDSNCRLAVSPSSQNRLRRRKRGRNRGDKTNSVPFAAYSQTSEQEVETGLQSQITRLPPACELVDEWLASGSVWAMPHFSLVRCRLYSMMHHLLTYSKRNTVPKKLKCLWQSTTAVVTEYRRVGRGSAASFQATEILVQPLSGEIWVEKGLHELLDFTGPTSTMNTVISCITGFRCSLTMGTDMSNIDEKHWLLAATSVMLPDQLALFLVLLGSVPCGVRGAFKTGETTTSSSLEGALRIVMVAWYHATLVGQVFHIVMDAPLILDHSRVSDVFCSDLVNSVWTAVQRIGDSELKNDDELLLSIELCLHFLSEQLDYQDSVTLEGLLDEWRQSTLAIFRLWHKLNTYKV